MGAALCILGNIPPGLVLIAGGAALPLFGRTGQRVLVMALPALALLLAWQVPDGPAWSVGFLEQQLAPLAGDRLSRLFATVFAVMAFGGGLYGLATARTLE